MKFKTIIILLFLGIMLSNTTAYSAESSIAFGFIANESENKDYDYLETVLRLSIASSIKNSSSIDVIDTDTSIKMLQKYKIELNKNLTHKEAKDAAKKIAGNFFLYGSFVPTNKNEIEITINLYSNKTEHFFTFTQTEKIRAEVRPLLDKITSILINFISKDEVYKAGRIENKSGIAFITDLSATEINEFYVPFLKSDYRVLLIQNHSLDIKPNRDGINAFYYIATDKSSYNNLSSIEKIMATDSSFAARNNQTLKSLEKACNYNLDYLLIVSFNKSKKSAWVRGIDVRNQALMWVQPEIKGKSIQDISDKILLHMSTNPQNIFD